MTSDKHIYGIKDSASLVRLNPKTMAGMLNESTRIWLKYCDLAICNMLSMITRIGFMTDQTISSLS